jgi:hypothetical protein
MSLNGVLKFNHASDLKTLCWCHRSSKKAAQSRLSDEA